MARSIGRIGIFGVAVVLGISSLSFADYRGDAEHARQRLDYAEAALSAAANDHYSAQAALSDAIAQQNSAASAAASAQQQADSSAAAVADAQSRIAAVAESSRTLGQTIAQKHAAFDHDKPVADDLAAQIEKYRNMKIAAFEASPEFRVRTADMLALQQQREAELDATIDWMQSTDVYAELFADVEEAEEIVRAHRAMQPPDDAALAAASTAWIETKNAIQAFMDDALSGDAMLRAATEQMTAAQDRHKALVEQFNKDLASDVELNRMIASLQSQQATLTALANEINQLEQQRAAADREYARLQSIITDETARMEQARRDAASFGYQANALAFDVSRYQTDVARLCDMELTARRERDFAARDLRAVIELANAQRVRIEIAGGYGSGYHGGYGGGYGGSRGGGFVHGGGGGDHRGGFVHGGGDDHRADSGGGHFSGPGSDRGGSRDGRAGNDPRRDDRSGNGSGSGNTGSVSGHGEPQNDQKQAELLAKDKVDRERIVREAEAKRAEDARLTGLSPTQQAREQAKSMDELIRRAEEQQRAGLRQEREQRQRQQGVSSAPAPAPAPAAAPAASIQPVAASSAGPRRTAPAVAHQPTVKPAAAAVAPTPVRDVPLSAALPSPAPAPAADSEKARREQAQRAVEAAEARDRQAQHQKQANRAGDEDQRRREATARADQEQAAARDRADRAAKDQADRAAAADRQASARAAAEARERDRSEAQAKAEQDRREKDRREAQAREAQSRAENDRRESQARESHTREAKAENDRREAQATADSDRREAQARADNERKENDRREAQARAENERRESERRRADDDRKQAEQRDHDRDKSFRK